MYKSIPALSFTLLASLCQGREVEGWYAIVEPKGGNPSNDGSIWIWQGDAHVEERVPSSDWIDATGWIPDGTEYSEATSRSTTVTTTTSWTVGGGATIDFATLSAGFGITQSLAVSTSQTQTLTVTVKCEGKPGKVQYQPLVTRFTGIIAHNFFGIGQVKGDDRNSVDVPEVTGSGGQLANYRFVCKDEGLEQGPAP